MSEPLTAEQLTAIKKLLAGNRESCDYRECCHYYAEELDGMANELVAEVERLRFELEYAISTRATVEEVARTLGKEVERLQFELKSMTESRRLACVGWDAAIEERERLQREVERLRAMNVGLVERAAALVEAHESDDGSNLCEHLAAKIRALLPCQ